jgi:threonyl-tRNA synthetase
MLVIGEKEMNEGQLSIRRQGKGDLGTVALNSFIESIKEEILERKSGD